MDGGKNNSSSNNMTNRMQTMSLGKVGNNGADNKGFAVIQTKDLGNGNTTEQTSPSNAYTVNLGSSTLRTNNSLEIKNNLLIDSGLTIYSEDSASNSTTFKAGSSGGALTLTFPSGSGSSGQYLKTNGSGSLSWSNVVTDPNDSITEGNTTVETVDTGSDGHIKFTTDGTERMRLDNTGSLLVDTIVEKTIENEPKDDLKEKRFKN